MKMPYVVGPPVRLPTDFFGRAGQTRQFFETLAGSQTQSVAVLGLRRAGKTSFLQHVSHPEVMSLFLPDPHRYLMVYVDISACKTTGDFYSRVYRKLLGGLSRVPAGVNRTSAVVDVYDVESLLYEFGDRRVVVLMDEFDQIRAANFDADFMTELRALAGVWEYELAYVTAAYWDNYRLGNFVGLPPTSPFYNIFYPSPIYLSGLSPSEIDALVKVPARRVGIVADDEDVSLVRYYAGTLPFFVQAVAATWLSFKVEGQKPDTHEVTSRLVPELWPYFEQWWRNFNDVERDVAIAVVQEKPVKRLPYGEEEIAQAVERLCCYGVIGSAGENLWADSALFGYWVRETTGRGQRNTANPPASIRNTVERNEDQVDQFGSRMSARFLQICTEVGRQFESLPLVYARKSDAELCDHLRVSLESGLGDDAGGLIFATIGGNGLVGHQNGRVAVAACCITWMGQKGLLRSVDQVLGQLTTSNTGAAIMVFARNGEAAVVPNAIAQAMGHHPAFMNAAGDFGSRKEFTFHSSVNLKIDIKFSVILVDLSC